jgi:DNA segregation ATPase FtsK/SpoIIIE-like protein
MNGSTDPLYEQAVALVRKHKRGSISLIQRHMQVGYNRAHAMIDAMVGTVLTDMPPIGKVIPAHDRPQLCRYGEPSPTFETQPCDCAAGTCRLGNVVVEPPHAPSVILSLPVRLSDSACNKLADDLCKLIDRHGIKADRVKIGMPDGSQP